MKEDDRLIFEAYTDSLMRESDFDDTAKFNKNPLGGPNWRPMDYTGKIEPLTPAQIAKKNKEEVSDYRNALKSQLKKTITGTEGRLLMNLRLDFIEGAVQELQEGLSDKGLTSNFRALYYFVDRMANELFRIINSRNLEEFKKSLKIKDEDWNDIIEYHSQNLPEPIKPENHPDFNKPKKQSITAKQARVAFKRGPVGR